MNYIFIDTEFTDFHNPELISIGFINHQTKDKFYVECSDFPINKASDFVKANIVPLLNFNEFGKPTNEAMKDCHIWLSKQGNSCVLGDWSGDWRILQNNILIPKNIEGFVLLQDAMAMALNIHSKENLTPVLDRYNSFVHEYILANNLTAHHALTDALANEWAFTKLFG